MKWYIFIVVLVALLVPATSSAHTSRTTQLRRDISWGRTQTWAWQDRAGVQRTRTEYAERHIVGLGYLRWQRRLWIHRRLAARHFYRAHPYRALVRAHYAFWMCVHRREGAWNANTGNGYFGGLQMTYGWGGVARPDLLAPADQIALAERNFIASGYSTQWLGGQWPNTSPPCLYLL